LSRERFLISPFASVVITPLTFNRPESIFPKCPIDLTVGLRLQE
jgi:hypothetical protein